jgi:diguanylate cyclase (GGDEF)-like protein
MDWQFDIRTAVAVCAFMTLLVDMLLLAVYRGLPVEFRPSLRWWLAGAVLHPLGFILLCLRGHAPDWLSVVAANTLLALALSFTAIALRRFYGVAERQLRLYVTTALVALFAVWLTYLHPDARLRVAILSGLLAVLIGSSARAFFRSDGPRGTIPMITGVVFVVGTLLMVYRGLHELLLPGTGEALFVNRPAQALTIGVIGVLPVVSTVGFLLICTERSQSELERAARLDYLTGISNRRAVEELSLRAIAAARRHGMPLAIMIIDVDHFKRINDEFGHQAGDKALAETVRRIQANLRTEDIVGRLGGEEFVVLMPNTDGRSAQAAAERIRAAFAGEPMCLGEHSLDVTVSVGVSILVAEDTLLSHMLRRADRAMYAAKAAGRNRVCMDALAQGG